MMRFVPAILAVFVLAIPIVLTQTWTDCNPLNTTCPNDPAFGISHTFVFNESSTVTDTFNITNGVLNYTNGATEFTINKRKDSPTICSDWYIMFGSVSVVMRAAKGTGVISSIVLESDDLDEVDWELMGGNATHAETNYFGKGNTTSYDRAVYYPVDSDVHENFHNYTLDWTAEHLKWMIDGTVVRVLNFSQANGGKNYPQTPMTLRLGIWAGGDPDQPKDVVEWAGGETDFTKGPYTMYVQQAQVRDYGSGKEYQYSDNSGSWQSIKSIAGNSTAAKTLLYPDPTLAQKWAALPQGSKIAVYTGSASGAALLVGAFAFFFIRQRRIGRKEREAYNAKIEAERDEKYKDQMELMEKSQGGWNKRDLASQGEDALGGWGSRHATPSIKDEVEPGYRANDDYYQRSDSPAFSRSGSSVHSPTLLGQVPLRANEWNGGNSGGIIHSAGNATKGGYSGTADPSSPFPTHNRSPPSLDRGLIGSAGNASTGGFRGSTNPGRASPAFPDTAFQFPAPHVRPAPPQNRGLIGAAHSARSGGYAVHVNNNYQASNESQQGSSMRGHYPNAGSVPQQGSMRGGYQRF
ncbi:concanavalin A-like lectin/glucanase domain-containing protein [Amylocarpus encephaloides]|uniref:chitinase n=1 Tax=Amylocarpus encephaloides TaxID=45428 RepID=A0A9P7YK59_9HELO|nr:concanavalin A-like lectin/glucanase domain-containing protein [Amylocarpus encephaloides]